MKIAVASGKGGTGKTLISSNLFNIIDNSVYLDCDVEEPNGHLFLKSKSINETSVTIPVPEVDQSKCTNCGRCSEVCQYNAIIGAKNTVLIFPELCHGCGSCALFCPQEAIKEKDREIGKIEITQYGEKKVYTGRLNIGEPMAPPVINKLKENINNDDKIYILDSPPGTSCPVIETIKDVDFVVLVTEPTPFGLNDLKLAVEVVRKLNLPMGIVVNKSGLGSNLIKDYCQEENLNLLLEIPHDKLVAEMYSRGELITANKNYKNIFEKLYSDIENEVKK